MNDIDIYSKNTAFLNLKPICDKVIQTPNISNLKEMLIIIRKIPPYVIQDLYEYIIFPLIIHFQNDSKSTDLNEDVRKMITLTIKEVIKNCKIKVAVFFRIYSILIKEIYDKKAPGFVSVAVHEEFKLVLVETIDILFKSICLESYTELYVEENIPKLAQGIYLCIQIAQREKLRSLKIASIRSAMSIMYLHDEADKTDIVLRAQISDLVIGIFPGVISSLTEIILADEKQGHLVIAEAIRAWGKVIELVMNDANIEKKSNNEFINEISKIQYIQINNSKGNYIDKNIDKDIEGKKQRIKRTPEWCESTKEKLKKLINRVSVIQRHSHFKVRLELVITCRNILENCSNTLNLSTGDFFDILIALSEDEYKEVAEPTKEALKLFSSKYYIENNKPISDILGERFYQAVNKLHYIVNSTDVSEQLEALNLVNGYLRLLKDCLWLMDSSILLTNLISALIHISQLEESAVPLLEECTIKEFEDKVYSTPWKKFEFLSEVNLHQKLYSICIIIGESDAVESVVNHLLDSFTCDLTNRKEITFLLNEILSANHKNIDLKINIVKNVLEVYLDPENWYLHTSLETEFEDGCVNVAEVKNNILQICLYTEGIGKMAIGIQDKFHRFLLKILYYVLERAGSNLEYISMSGMKCLQDVNKALNCNGVTELLKSNVDYFVHHIIIKLRHIDRHPEVLDVLSVVMKNCTIDVLPFLQDIVSDALLSSCDTYKQKSVIHFLKIFYIFVNCVKRWQDNKVVENKPPKINTDIKVTDPDEELNEYKRIIEEVEQYEKEKTVEQMYLEDVAKQEQIPEEPDYKEPTEIKQKPPLEIELVVCVMKRCLHFLPMKNKQHKLIVIDTLNIGIQVIQYWEDELLPLVHLIWSPLEDRFQEKNEHLIIHRSFLLLYTLAETSKDFIRLRTSKKVLPQICTYLQEMVNDSKKPKRNVSYFYTQQYKMQLALLERISSFSVLLDLADQHIEMVFSALCVYLSNLQPLQFQESCLKSLTELMNMYPKILQPKLNHLCCNISQEYQKNINRLKGILENNMAV